MSAFRSISKGYDFGMSGWILQGVAQICTLAQDRTVFNDYRTDRDISQAGGMCCEHKRTSHEHFVF